MDHIDMVVMLTTPAANCISSLAADELVMQFAAGVVISIAIG
jgi:hypothetical protein